MYKFIDEVTGKEMTAIRTFVHVTFPGDKKGLCMDHYNDKADNHILIVDAIPDPDVKFHCKVKKEHIYLTESELRDKVKNDYGVELNIAYHKTKSKTNPRGEIKNFAELYTIEHLQKPKENEEHYIIFIDGNKKTYKGNKFDLGEDIMRYNNLDVAVPGFNWSADIKAKKLHGRAPIFDAIWTYRITHNNYDTFKKYRVFVFNEDVHELYFSYHDLNHFNHGVHACAYILDWCDSGDPNTSCNYAQHRQLIEAWGASNPEYGKLLEKHITFTDVDKVRRRRVKPLRTAFIDDVNKIVYGIEPGDSILR